MKIVVLDAKTLGDDIDLSPISVLGDVVIYDSSFPEQTQERVRGFDIIVSNKVRLDEETLKYADRLKIICLAATGYDPVDTEYCRKNKIAVCNVKGYSTHSVAQLTVAMALSLFNRLPEYCSYTSSGEYTKSGIANHVSPCYNEICGKSWGIVGLGNIGRQVAKVAEALGCNVFAFNRTGSDRIKCVDIDTLVSESDIISVHLPLTDETCNLINAERIGKMRKNALFINVARGAVADERALAEAIKGGKIGGIGMDVYSEEPFSKKHPFYEIKDYKNVCLTPHMAWAAYESRKRCIEEIVLNIKAFINNEKRNRVEII